MMNKRHKRIRLVDLTPEQQEHMDAVIRALVERTVEAMDRTIAALEAKKIVLPGEHGHDDATDTTKINTPVT